MSDDSPTQNNDERLVRDLEAVYARVQEAVAADSPPERSGVLNSLEVMLAPPVRAARLLLEDRPPHGTGAAGAA